MAALIAAAVVVVGVWFEIGHRRRRRAETEHVIRQFDDERPAGAVEHTGRSLRGKVTEILPGQGVAVVHLNGGAMLVLPDEDYYVGQSIVVYEYADGTWHHGLHPSWGADA